MPEDGAPAAAGAPQPATGPRRTGRRVALVVYWLVCAWICVAGAASVTVAVFAGPPAGSPRFTSCAAGMHALAAGLDSARAAGTAGEGTEDDALDRFRAALGPAWAARDAVAAVCRGNPADEGALDAIERLRYAEEHAVRREAGELAPLRRRVQRLLDDMPSPSSASSAPLPAGLETPKARP
ncbi:MAG TPA: hypothetical protein VGM56_12985 [Byssovorax sp.]|jgi:hypothetical protein